MRKLDIVEIALENLKNATAIEGIYIAEEVLLGNIKFDGIVKIFLKSKEKAFEIIVKENLISAYIEENLRNFQPSSLLISTHLNTKNRQKLREAGISYLDINGNFYINDEDFFIFIEKEVNDNHLSISPKRKVWNRIFSKQGMIFIFELLSNRHILQNTYTEMAQKTGIDARKINEIIKNLSDLGVIDKEERIFLNADILEEEWFLGYEYKLKPDKFIGRFSFINSLKREEWQSIALDTSKTVWGGESAAYLLDFHLYPEIFTLYTEESRNELIRKYKLIPNPNGEIHVYEKFWKDNYSHKEIAPLPVIYVDLFYSESGRCQEEANRLRNAYSLFSNKHEERRQKLKILYTK